MTHLCIVIVKFGKHLETNSLLASIASQTLQPDGVILVDNDQTSFRPELIYIPNLKLFYINSGRNLGYTAGVNAGVSLANSLGAHCILLLSPDILFPSTDTLQLIVDSYQHNCNNSIMGVSQLNPDGTYEQIARRWPNLPAQLARKSALLSFFFKNQLLRYMSIDCSYDPLSHVSCVPWLQSSLVIFSRNVWSMVGPLNSRYFVFMADVDLCLQASRKSVPVLLDRSILVKADGVRSGGKNLKDVLLTRAGRIHAKDALSYAFSHPLSFFFGCNP